MIKGLIGRWGAVPLALLKEDWLTLNAIKVYTTLAAYQGFNEDCWPSREVIAQESGLSQRWVSSAVTKLHGKGWIVRRRRFNKSSVYMVLQPVTEVCDGNSHVTETVPSIVTETVPSIVTETVPLITTHRTASKTSSDAPEKLEEAESRKIILDTCLEHSVISKHEYPKEMKLMKLLIEYLGEVAKQFGRKLKDVSSQFVQAFRVLRKTDRFFKDKPFIPSFLWAVHAQVFEKMKGGLTVVERKIDIYSKEFERMKEEYDQGYDRISRLTLVSGSYDQKRAWRAIGTNRYQN